MGDIIFAFIIGLMVGVVIMCLCDGLSRDRRDEDV